MVMVANQRTRYQMQDELILFLDDQTEEFVDWLHSKALKQLGANGESKDKIDKPKKDDKVPKEDKHKDKHGRKRLDSKSHKSKDKAKVKEKTPEPERKKSPPPPPIVHSTTKSASPATNENIVLHRSPSPASSHKRSPSPPSPVIIINNPKPPRPVVEQVEEYQPELKSVMIRKPVAAPSQRSVSLISTVARVIQRQEVDEEDEEEEVPSVSSVIKVKDRIPIPKDRQASRRLFMAQTSFLRPDTSSQESSQSDTDNNEDLRSVLQRKRKRDWNRTDGERFSEPGDQEFEQNLDPEPIVEEVASKKTRFIVTLNGAEKRKTVSDSFVEEVDEPVVEEEQDAGEKCRFYPNCKNNKCPYIHDDEDVSQQFCK